MPYGVYLSASGAHAQSHRMKMLSNNLANVDTPGFKPQETMYTRAGNLDINADGDLVIGSAQTGRRLDPPINSPPDAENLVITPNGEVQVRIPGQTELVVQGQIELAKFINPDGLLKNGENM